MDSGVLQQLGRGQLFYAHIAIQADLFVSLQSVAAISINSPEAYIAETGWPTASLNASLANDGATGSQGDANVENLQSRPFKTHVVSKVNILNSFLGHLCLSGKQQWNKVLLVSFSLCMLHPAHGPLSFEAFDEPWKA